MTQQDTDKVNINHNPRVPEGSPLPYPAHKVFGVLPDEDAAWQAIDELKRGGFAAEDIELWGALAGAQAIQESFTQSGLRGRLTRLAQRLGEEGESIQLYDEALRAGRFLLVMLAPDTDAKDVVRDIMARHGGRFISFFDDLTIETMVR